MPTNEVDDMTCGLEAEGTGRRGLLRGIPAAALAGVLGLIAPKAAARRKKKKPLCVRCPKMCETPHFVLCKPLTATEVCACAWTTAGKETCVNTDAGLNCDDPVDECETNADCDTGEACIPIDDQNCCTETTGNRCLPVCTV